MPGGCERCPYGPRRQVAGVLQGGCDLLIVGEGPGDDEIRRGRPFTGPSGRLLWEALRRSGLDVRYTPESLSSANGIKISVTNATCCRPLSAEKGKMDALAATCRPRLQNEIEQERPKVILALGNTAIRSITGDAGIKITNVCGSCIQLPMASDDEQQRPYLVVPAIHPAALLHGGGSDYGKMQRAFHYAVDLVRGVERRHPGETKYYVATKQNIWQVARRMIGMERGTLLGADIETTGLNARKHKIRCLGVAWKKNKVIIFDRDLLEPAIHPAVRLIVESSRFRWIWHNGKFDTAFFWQRGVKARVDEDIMLMHYALDEVRGTHDLEQLANERLGADDYKDAIDKYRKNGWVGVPRKDLFEYLAKDCDYTLQLYHQLEEELRMEGNEGLPELYRGRMLEHSNFFRKMERRGIYVHRPALEPLKEELQRQLDSAYERCQQAVQEMWPNTRYAKDTGAPPPIINPGSPKQVGHFLYEVLELKPPKGFAKNTDKDTLKALPSNPYLEAHADFKKAQKAQGTYAEGMEKWIEEDGRVHTTVLIHGTVTGRPSSQKPNVFNIPRRPVMRGIFQAPPGKWLIEADLKSAEIVALANLSKDEFLCSTLNAGRNLHKEVSLDLYGENYTKDDYFRAKALNFGIMYGRGAESLVMEFGSPAARDSEGNPLPKERWLTQPKAKELIVKWKARFPEAVAFIEWCRSHPREGKFLTSLTGRRRRFGLITSSNLNALENEAANFPLQSLAYDVCSTAAFRLDDWIEEQGGGIVNIIYDAILIEVPQDMDLVMRISTRIGEEFRRAGEELGCTSVPFRGEFALTQAWGDPNAQELEI